MNALIPARGGSKGVPRKNIKMLMGHPLIAYSIVACQKTKGIDRVIVSTDDEEIAGIALKYGAEVPFMRPDEYAQDNSTDNSVLSHYFEEVKNSPFVAFMRPTAPLRDPSVIQRCIDSFFKNKNSCSSIRSMHELPEPPYKMLKINESGYCEGLFDNFVGEKNYMNLPRQVFPKTYHPNGYVDIIKEAQVNTGNTYGELIRPFITEFCIEIDTPYQFDLLEFEMNQNGCHILEDLENDKYKK